MGKGSANFEDWVVSAQKREEEDFLSFFFLFAFEKYNL